MVDYMPVVMLDEESIQVSVDGADLLCCKIVMYVVHVLIPSCAQIDISSQKFSYESPALPQMALKVMDIANLKPMPLDSSKEHLCGPDLHAQVSCCVQQLCEIDLTAP